MGDEQKSSIAQLKSENKKVRAENAKVKEKWEKVMDTNTKLLKKAEESATIYGKNDAKMNKVEAKNKELKSTIANAKTQNREMKDTVDEKQEQYMIQAETRLEY